MTKKRLERTKDGKKIPIYYYGDRFESMRDLAKHLNITVNQIKWALTDNYYEEIIEKEVSSILEKSFIGQRCYVVFGKNFLTLTEIAEAFGLKESAIQMIHFRYKERNLFEEEVMKRMSTEPITFQGVEYESLSILCSKHRIDYPTFIRRFRIEGWSMEDSLTAPVVASKGHSNHFRGVDYLSIRELYNSFNYAASMDSRFKVQYPNENSLELFDEYLNFVEENGLEPNEDMLTTMPMVYYDGNYYNRAISFYEEFGITSRNVGHEKNAKENIGLELEQIVSNMSIRINQHTGERLFPNCTINPNAKLFFLKNRFLEHLKTKFTK